MPSNLRPDDDLQSRSPEIGDARTAIHCSPSESRFALSEGFRRLIAMGLQEANPNIIPYELRVDPPHRRLIIPKLDTLHQVSAGKLGDE